MSDGSSHPDQIRVRAMQVSAHIGVPEEERSQPQTLEIDLAIIPDQPLTDLDDEIGRTVDYFQVWERVRALAEERPRKLIETLAEEISKDLLSIDRIVSVEVTVRKFILPETACVEVSIQRQRENREK